MVQKNNNLILHPSKHNVKTKLMNHFHSKVLDYTMGSIIIYIVTESEMNYLTNTKDCFTKELRRYHNSRSFMAKEFRNFYDASI